MIVVRNRITSAEMWASSAAPSVYSVYMSVMSWFTWLSALAPISPRPAIRRLTAICFQDGLGRHERVQRITIRSPRPTSHHVP
jgi:hypothetical protein